MQNKSHKLAVITANLKLSYTPKFESFLKNDLMPLDMRPFLHQLSKETTYQPYGISHQSFLLGRNAHTNNQE